MSDPLSADQFIAALRAEGVTVVEVGDWRNHNRNHKGAWGPVNGVVIHHTASSGTRDTVDYCYDGDEELPGPLCHGVIDKEGTVHLVGNGRTNHAGKGDAAVLDAVIQESALPRATVQNTDGNVRFYGFECINEGDGKDPWPAAQLEAIERVSAAVCRAHGWGSGSVIGHKEWSIEKIDPVGFGMDGMRKRIAKRLGSGPSPCNEPFPGSEFFRAAPRSAVIAAMGRRLVEEGCSAYLDGPGPRWTDADRQSYAKWQRKLGFSGSDADGWPGKASWDALRVPTS
ncbi:peptidoglycan-binding protein [Streptomyces luteireticuli]|uniref:peptidoglycan-binding protein n=1 Tax=Streptomyces luteireticuli TaxID=173858 RepID=UPI00355822DD